MLDHQDGFITAEWVVVPVQVLPVQLAKEEKFLL
jgi:hypothetical protein